MRASRVVPLSALLALLALAGTAPTALAQEEPVVGRNLSLSIQGGILLPDDFGVSFGTHGARTVHQAESGPVLGLRFASPEWLGIAVEAAWDFALTRTIEVDNGRRRRGPGHKVHAYVVGARYAPLRGARIRPRASIGIGGITFLTEGRPGTGGSETGSATDLAVALDAGLIVPFHRRYGLRIDVRDLVQFCEEPERRGLDEGFDPCIEDGPRHHVALLVGIETAF